MFCIAGAMPVLSEAACFVFAGAMPVLSEAACFVLQVPCLFYLKLHVLYCSCHA